MKAISLIPRNILGRQFTKFLLVGALNSLFGYGCFAIFLYFGLHYAAALFFSTILGVAFNFKSTGAFVFESHNNRLIFRFIASYTVVYLVNTAGIKIFTGLGCAPYIGGAILIMPMAILAFILNKRFVFNYD